ncbi:hypothetical protein MMH89_00625 [Candidatus Comchoanobacter bicostacola]|uniref:Uncharacterized protein n=1 Tax=Candidatus Comchoanobacter bicostacola TaxID=2919598 RepID=A0ABY5DLC6_9GAMM|nr:hypothetical protein [Candidatus Comchoanobacter bicostacola]UTC24669.1 hypothetical protein MMH89_00625 [Candidatus Comchoanobacter bicostacola]
MATPANEKIEKRIKRIIDEVQSTISTKNDNEQKEHTKTLREKAKPANHKKPRRNN